MAKKKRNYAQEEKLNDTPKQRAEQAARMRARRRAEREGKVRKHDSKQVDHKDFNPLNNSKKNIRILSKKANESRQPKRR